MRPRISAAARCEGFTLAESLVALAILSVVVGVVVHVHLQTLRAGEFSRLREGAMLEAETVLTGLMLGNDPKTVMDDAGKEGWRVTAERAGGAGGPAFREWRVAASNPSAPAVSMVLRDGPVSAAGGSGGSDGSGGSAGGTKENP